MQTIPPQPSVKTFYILIIISGIQVFVIFFVVAQIKKTHTWVKMSLLLEEICIMIETGKLGYKPEQLMFVYVYRKTAFPVFSQVHEMLTQPTVKNIQY